MYDSIIFTNEIKDDHEAKDQSINYLHFLQLGEKIIIALMKNLFSSVASDYSSAL